MSSSVLSGEGVRRPINVTIRGQRSTGARRMARLKIECSLKMERKFEFVRV